MNLRFAVLAGLVVSALSLHAQVPDPGTPTQFHTHQFGKKDRQQYCYTDFWLEANGDWRAHTLFSNGKKIDGDHFKAELTIANKSGGNAVYVKHLAGMNRAHTHHARERVVDSSGHADGLKPSDLGNITFLCATDRDEQDDKKNADAIIYIVKKLAGFG